MSGRHPPHVRLTVRVGISGHRPNRLPTTGWEPLRAAIREVLSGIRTTIEEVHQETSGDYAPQPPLLRIISSLAEGADRLVAVEAVRLGFELQCPLPFARDEYAHDFKAAEADGGDSINEYWQLLSVASSVLELDGSRACEETKAAAYAAAGRQLLNQSDVLIAIWNGKPSSGFGGTAQIVDEAAQASIPVIWIDSTAPHAAVALFGGHGEATRAGQITEVYERLKLTIRPPAVLAGGDSPSLDLRPFYLAETQPRWSLMGWTWSAFRDLVAGSRPPLPRLRVANFVGETTERWRRQRASLPATERAVVEQIDQATVAHFAWADGLATYYANEFRSGFTINALAGAAALLIMLLVYVFGGPARAVGTERSLKAVTLIVITLVFLNWLRSYLHHWHERWLDYRLLAELLRAVRFLGLLGYPPPLIQNPAHSGYGDPESTWMVWHARAVVRAMGMIDARVNATYLQVCRRMLLREFFQAQIAYHADNERRLGALEHRLRLLTYPAFAATPVILGLLLFVDFRWLAILAALLPAIGAAAATIRNLAETARVAKRSYAMTEHLTRIAGNVESMKPLSLTGLGRETASAVNGMLAEALDWHQLLQSREWELA
jgi:hypothetical protein